MNTGRVFPEQSCGALLGAVLQHVLKVNTYLLLHEQPVSCFNVWGHEAILHPRPVTRHIANIGQTLTTSAGSRSPDG